MKRVLVLTLVLPTLACLPQAQRTGLSDAARPVTRPTTAPAPVSFLDRDLETDVCPPPGWRLDPPKASGQHVHKTWISPTGATAYGVIKFKLPLPVGVDWALWGFLREMKRTEGEALLVEKESDPNLPFGGGLRFVAEGGLYKVRTNLVVRGLTGWAVYAGTLRKRDEIPAELEDAARARESTRVGVDIGPATTQATSR